MRWAFNKVARMQRLEVSNPELPNPLGWDTPVLIP